MTDPQIRPENRGVQNTRENPKPWEMDPELAQLKMAELLVERLGSPNIQDKEFAVRYGIFSALNNSKDNPTGYDSSLRLEVYRKYLEQSVNQEGLYFRNIWAYLMRPKYIINGMVPPGMAEPEKESAIGRFVNWVRGGKRNDQQSTA